MVLYPNIGEKALVHLNSYGGCQLPIMMANQFFKDVKKYNLNYRMAQIHYYTSNLQIVRQVLRFSIQPRKELFIF